MTLPLSGCSFGWLHLAPLPDALRALASRGFSSLSSPPRRRTCRRRAPGRTSARNWRASSMIWDYG